MKTFSNNSQFNKYLIIYIKYRNKKFLNFLFVFFSIYCLKIVEKHFVQFNNFDKKNCRFQLFSIICRQYLSAALTTKNTSLHLTNNNESTSNF